MANYDNNNTGVLFKNDRKQSDRHPDFKGSAEVNGVQYWLAAWKRQSKDGNGLLSIVFEPKDKGGDDMPSGDDFDI